MYRDNTLIPTETIRLAALGTLLERDVRYSELAAEVRYFVGRIIGPSLDLLGTSLELLTYEGLIEAVGGADGDASVTNGLLRITEQGREAFATLMTSHVRAPVNDVSRLVVALKMRFLHLLDGPGRVHRFERKHPELTERIPKKELAAYLNLSAETLSRLKQRGKI